MADQNGKQILPENLTIKNKVPLRESKGRVILVEGFYI
jgi:hypothetical protein